MKDDGPTTLVWVMPWTAGAAKGASRTEVNEHRQAVVEAAARGALADGTLLGRSDGGSGSGGDGSGDDGEGGGKPPRPLPFATLRMMAAIAAEAFRSPRTTSVLTSDPNVDRGRIKVRRVR